jgi:hypothetical protein
MLCEPNVSFFGCSSIKSAQKKITFGWVIRNSVKIIDDFFDTLALFNETIRSFQQILFVFQSRQYSRLTGDIDVVRLFDIHQVLNQVRRGHRIANPKTG